MPPAPASMFFTNRSCPGTSTKARLTPSARGGKPEIEVTRARAFLQPIRIGARQRANERALAVIDMHRGADDMERSSHRGLPRSRSLLAAGRCARRCRLRAERFGRLRERIAWPPSRTIASARKGGRLGCEGPVPPGFPPIGCVQVNAASLGPRLSRFATRSRISAIRDACGAPAT